MLDQTDKESTDSGADSDLSDYREAVQDLYYSWNNALLEVGARDDTKGEM